MRKTSPTTEQTARDITRGVYEDVIGPHIQTHRSERQA